MFQSPISGVNDWNLALIGDNIIKLPRFQSPISGVNDWNTVYGFDVNSMYPCFSLLLAELMIGTTKATPPVAAVISMFQSPISGVNDWN